jgi:mono/diheme cytochrome c family protein
MMIVFLIRSLAMKSLFTALSAGIVLVAVSGVASAEEPADPQAGFEYAQTYCATCHGIWRKNRLCLRPRASGTSPIRPA